MPALAPVAPRLQVRRTGTTSNGTIDTVAVIRLFASARDAAGRGTDVIDGDTVGDVLDGAIAKFGPVFATVLDTCRIWVNGDSAQRSTAVRPSDEVAVLPPVSGG